MGSIFADFHEAQQLGDGRLLASCLVPVDTARDPLRVQAFAQLSNHQMIAADVRYHLVQQQQHRGAVKLPKAEANAWVDIFVALWKCVRELFALEQGHGAGDWVKAFAAYKEMCNLLVRGYTNFGFQSWTVPCLYVAGKYVRLIAIKADSQANKSTGDGFVNGFSDDVVAETNKHDKLEQAAWTINRMFTVCLSDRADLAESRKWGIYSTTNLLFKTYFKLNSISLTRNVIRALEAASDDLPPLDKFPKSHRCTFKYYRGVIDFLQENYVEAEENLTEALGLCHKDSLKNREQILTYLIPAHIVNRHQLPTDAFLAMHPTLYQIFTPFFTAIRKGSLASFDQALAAAEPEFVRRRIYLTLERTRDLCLRNLFRNVFLAAGWEEDGKIRRTRIRIDEFEAGMRVGYKGATDVVLERDVVECFLANMIYKVRFFLWATARRHLWGCVSAPSGQTAAAWVKWLPVKWPPDVGRRCCSITVSRFGLTKPSTEHDERLHRPRSRHRRAQQGWCLSWHRGLNGLQSRICPHDLADLALMCCHGSILSVYSTFPI
jgi:hypothetical protein